MPGAARPTPAPALRPDFFIEKTGSPAPKPSCGRRRSKKCRAPGKRRSSLFCRIGGGMNFRRFSAATLGFWAGAAWLLAAGCARTPKYVAYLSNFGDFVCDVPSEWAVILDQSGKDYYQVLFTGPFEPSFYRA